MRRKTPPKSNTGRNSQGSLLCSLPRTALIEDVAAILATFRTQFNLPVGIADYLGVVFYHEDAVPPIPQLVKEFYELGSVPLVQAHTRLIQNIEQVYFIFIWKFSNLRGFFKS